MFDFFSFRISREKKSWIDLERKQEVMLSVLKTSRSFSTFGHMKQADAQETKKMSSEREVERSSTSNMQSTRLKKWKQRYF